MGRPQKVRETKPECDKATMDELAALRADLRALAAYIADRDQLRPNAHGARIAEIALEQ